VRLSSADLSDLLGRIYQASLEPAAWDAFLLASLPCMTASSANFLMVDSRSPARIAGAVVGADEAIQKAYETYFAERNVIVQAAARESLIYSGSIVASDQILARDEFEGSEYYQDFLRLHDIHTIIGGATYRTESRSGLISYQRPRAAGPVTEDEIGNLRLLLPHLQRAQDIHRHLAGSRIQQEIQSTLLDRLEVGAVLFGPDGSILLANRSAERTFAEKDGLGVCRGGLRADDTDESARLGALISAVLRTGNGHGSDPGGAMTVSRRSGRRGYQVLVTPLPLSAPRPGHPSAAAAVFVNDPERSVGGIGHLLRGYYGLTPAEADLAALLVDGRSLEEAADLMGVTRNTARVHMKRVFTKTETRRQGELIRLLLIGVSGLSGR
jgi:DNA-binding CsgD family transcriptional regulator/PAS domain-containing protein